LENPLKVAELLSDIELWQTTVEKGRQAWQRAQSACVENEPLIAQSTQSRLRTVKENMLSEENCYRLAKELDDIWSDALTWIIGKLQVQVVQLRYAVFFTKQGLDVDRGGKAQGIAALRSSPIRLALVAALDHWAQFTALGNPNDQQLVRLLELARAADPDPWRDRFREAALWQDPAALARLAEEVNVEEQSPTILAALVFCLVHNDGNSTRILNRALPAHPRDFWLRWHAAFCATDPAESARLFMATLAIRPKSAVAYCNLGSALTAQKDLPAATAALKKAIQLDAKYAAGYYNLGVVLREQKDLAGAISAYKKVIELDPKCVFAYINLGNALREQKDLPEAIAAYKKAIALDPTYATAYYNLGIALKDQRDLPGALVAFKKAVALDPNYTAAYNNLGLVLRENKDLVGAIAAFKKAIGVDPDYAIAYCNLGIALKDQKDLVGAIAAYKKAIGIDPKYAFAYFNLGIALREQNDLPGAILAFKKAIEIDPDYAFAYYYLGNVLRMQNDMPGAISAYKKATELNPKFVSAYNNLGAALRDQRDFQGAIGAFNKAIELNPTLSLAHENLGMTLHRQGNFSEAGKAYLKAIHEDKANRRAYNAIAWLLATCPDDKFRDGKRAVLYATEACRLTDWKAGSYFNTLAAAYAEAGQFEKAIEYQTQALKDRAYADNSGESARQRLTLYRNNKPYRDQ
jgi:tetratricopeptide (TPR) repeat protein